MVDTPPALCSSLAFARRVALNHILSATAIEPHFHSTFLGASSLENNQQVSYSFYGTPDRMELSNTGFRHEYAVVRRRRSLATSHVPVPVATANISQNECKYQQKISILRFLQE